MPTFTRGCNAGGTARFMSLYEQWPHGAIVAQHGITGDDFQALFDTMWPQGFTPIDVSAYVIDGQARYTVIWEQRLAAAWPRRPRAAWRMALKRRAGLKPGSWPRLRTS